MELTTDTLYFDRNLQEAYFTTKGVVKDSATTLTSIEGRYFMPKNKYQFLKDVEITNPEYKVNSAQLDYYTDSKHVLLQALEFYPDNAKIEYRLAGIYFILGEQNKGTFHLKNALRNDFKKHLMFQQLFPGVFMRISVKNIISQFKKSST